MKNDRLIQEWLNNDLSPEEKERMEKIMALSEKLDVPAQKTKTQAWNDLIDKIDSESQDNGRILTTPRKNSRRYFFQIAAAAIALVLIYLNFFYDNAVITKKTGPGETLTVTLPDESKVTLNASSILTYEENGWNSNRWVSLSGEAFFEVTPGKAFKVIGGFYEIKVIGTSFNVFNRSKALEVSVSTGEVEVKSGNEITPLIRGEMVKLENKELMESTFDSSKVASWREGNFYFDAEPFSKVLQELERQFDIEVKIDTEISDRFYSGYFSKSDLSEALQLICVPMGLSYQLKDEQIIIE